MREAGSWLVEQGICVQSPEGLTAAVHMPFQSTRGFSDVGLNGLADVIYQSDIFLQLNWPASRKKMASRLWNFC